MDHPSRQPTARPPATRGGGGRGSLHTSRSSSSSSLAAAALLRLGFLSLVPGADAGRLDFDEASFVQKGRWQAGGSLAEAEDICGKDTYVRSGVPGPQVRNYTGLGSQKVQHDGGLQPPLPRRVAIGFHGQYRREEHDVHNRPKCSNFFSSQQNIQQQVIKPLLDLGIEVAVYFHTVTADKDQALVDTLKPKKYQIESVVPNLVKDSYRKVMHLITSTEPPSTSTAVILLRFDVQYRVPVIDLDIKWDKVNFAFRDVKNFWNRCRKASDLFHVLPLSAAPAFAEALDDSRKKSRCWDANGSAHFLYEPLRLRLGEERLHFISPICQSSTIIWPWNFHGPVQNTFLGIDRQCSAGGDGGV